MKEKTRKPTHPGIVLEEHYIKPLKLNLQQLSSHLDIARNTLYKIRAGKAAVTPAIAMKFAEAFETTPELWLNLQQKYDLWIEAHSRHKRILPIPQIKEEYIPEKPDIKSKLRRGSPKSHKHTPLKPQTLCQNRCR